MTGFRIKRVFDPPAHADGLRVLVDRLWPRGLSKAEAAIDHWLRDLAPSTELRRWFGHDPVRWDEFCRRYAHELEGREQELTFLQEAADVMTVTLLFAAKDASHNNAVALLRHLEQRKGGAPEPSASDQRS